MRFLLLGLLVSTGCILDSGPDDYDATLAAFIKPHVVLGDTQSGTPSLLVNLEPRELYPDQNGACPVLANATATVGDTTLHRNNDGGYDDFWSECEIVQFYLASVPAVAGASVEIHAGDSAVSCALHDANVPRALEITDGGAWTRPSAAQTIALQFVPALEMDITMTASVTPTSGTQTPIMVAVTTTAEGYTLHLPALNTDVYRLSLSTSTPVTSNGECTITARPYAQAMLTIVAP